MENFNQEYIADTELRKKVPDEPAYKYSQNNPPWNTPVAFGLWFASVILIVILQMLFVFPYVASQNVNFNDQQSFMTFVSNDPTAIFLQIAAVVPAHIITLIIAWLIITRINKYSFKEMLGWHWGGYNWWQTALWTVFLVGIVFAMAITMTYIYGDSENDLDKILKSSRYAVFLVAILATFSAPLVEEVVYRGVLYSALQRTTNIPIAVIMVTFVFAVVHFFQYWGDQATIITITFLSLLLTLIRVKTNSLLPCIFFHFVINGIQSFFLILQPYLPEAIDNTKIEGFFFLLK